MKSIITLLLILGITTQNICQKFNTISQKTDQHQLIKGTKIMLVPPPDFKVSETLKGFQDPTDPYSMIMVMEIPGPFEAVSAGFDSEKMATKNMTLISKKQVKIDNYKGYLVELTQPSGNLNYAKHLLVYGDSSFTTIINGVYLADSVDLGNKMLASIKTIFIDNTIVANPRAELGYIITETDTDFKYKAVIGNGTLFEYKKPHTNIISYLVDASFIKSKATDKKQFCINRLAQYDQKYQFIKTKGITEVTLGGLKGYSLYGQSLINKEEQIFQTILFNDNFYYYILCGVYPKSMEFLVEDFKKMNASFSLK